MKFTLVSDPSYWWPVTVRVPDPDPARAGALVDQTFKVLFRPKSRDQVLADQKRFAAITDEGDRVDAEIADVLLIVRDWQGVEDDHGAGVPFTPEALRVAMGHTWFRAGINKALAESLYGIEATAGN